MSWKEKLKKSWKESKISNLEADVELLKKRRKNTKHFSWYHLFFYLIFFVIATYGTIILMMASTVKEPTLHLTTMIVGLGVGINLILYASLRNYITSLDWGRDGKFYDILIYLKELKENKKL